MKTQFIILLSLLLAIPAQAQFSKSIAFKAAAVKRATGGGGGAETAWVTSLTPATPAGFSIPLGIHLTVGASPVVVSSLGAYRGTGNTGTRVVQIRSLGCTVVASGTVDLSTVSVGQFAYVSITPFTLSAATEYYLFRVEDGSQNSLDESTCSVTGVAVLTSSAYFSGSCTSGTSGKQYGGVNFKYTSP